MVLKKAHRPEELAQLFIEFANAGDVEGLVSLYEPSAVLAVAEGQVMGHEAIRAFYEKLLAARPQFQPGDQHAPLLQGDLALTSTRLTTGGATAEIARRQSDGSWRWIADRPNVVG